MQSAYFNSTNIIIIDFNVMLLLYQLVHINHLIFIVINNIWNYLHGEINSI